MAEWFASGRIIDVILALVFVEAAALALFLIKTGRGIAIGQLASNLVAGGALMLALRFALVGAWWGYISAAMLVALLAHVVELAQRWR